MNRLLKRKLKFYVLISCFIFVPLAIVAQHPTTVRSYEKEMTTYPFSNPDPVPTFSFVYPYFRYDQFTSQPLKKKWKIVELENDYIKLLITPEIGGKIWTAINKKTNKAFIYNNDAVKFRDIALRGPWTSGGLEANFGIFGHTPGVATPVDYTTKQNKDGSAECTIGLLDLLTQTNWRVKIILPKDKAYFITKAIWHNGSGIDQPYYTWMNLGIKTRDSLMYLEPGNHYLGHDGSVHDWPLDENSHKNISIYAQNNFGSYKSYHVTGVYSKYWGAYWQKENSGMVHYAERGDKIGKKVWIWGLSRQGMIWEKLLTDNSGQYSELQSGRLYNQNAENSLYSPFKQTSFSPYGTDQWSEYWYPFAHTEGAICADLNGVFNLKRERNVATVYFSSIAFINDTLKVWDTKNRLLLKQPISLTPLQSFKKEFFIDEGDSVSIIRLANTKIQLQNLNEKKLDRPLKAYEPFDWHSSYGLYTKGFYQARRHDYKGAEESIDSALQKEPGLLPALSEMALLQYHKMNFDGAFAYAQKALSINTYDAKANYYYGLAALKLHKREDAADGFQVATITSSYRSAAYTQLSKMALQDKNYKNALVLANRALETNMLNITALQLKSIVARLMHKDALAKVVNSQIIKLDPLNHCVKFEYYWENKSTATLNAFISSIKSELPQQTYLDLINWYTQLGLENEAKQLINIAPQKDGEMLYWQAWLNRESPMLKQYLAQAEAQSAKMVFPFREASAEVMHWAMQHTSSWKPTYYLALIYAGRNQPQRALRLLETIQDTITFAPFYVVKARLESTNDSPQALRDFKKAVILDSIDWRYRKYLAQYYIKLGNNKEALQTIRVYSQMHPKNYVAGLLYIQSLILNEEYKKAEDVLDKIDVLPFEGASEGHKYYRQTKLMLALYAIELGKYTEAKIKVKEALLWPERLGAGKPYDLELDTSLEQSLLKIIDNRSILSKEEINKKTHEILKNT